MKERGEYCKQCKNRGTGQTPFGDMPYCRVIPGANIDTAQFAMINLPIITTRHYIFK